MESVQNAASAAYNTASKLIFGEQPQAASQSGTEPLSGHAGAGTAASPFDQGNAVDGAAPASASRAALQGEAESGTEPLAGVQGAGTAGEPFDQGNAVDGAAAGQAGSQHAPPAAASLSSSGLGSDGLAAAASPVADSENRVVPTRDAREKQRDAVEAAGHATEPARRVVVDNTAEGGNDLSGEAVKAKATGEQYGRSTGLAADGGDFDASKPGAGAEATRLVEAKSVDDEVKDEKKKERRDEVEKHAGAADDGKAKPKLSERIKDKLHIHKN